MLFAGCEINRDGCASRVAQCAALGIEEAMEGDRSSAAVLAIVLTGASFQRRTLSHPQGFLAGLQVAAWLL
jgi:hypothetical protein